MTIYHRPGSVDEALRALHSGRFTVVAGGTDFYPARVGKPIDEPVLDISALRELREIREEEDRFRIGAGVTWSDIVRATLPDGFAVLQQAGREVGGVQIQNVATVCGNVCNASPAADGVPALLALDAEVEVRTMGGAKRVPLGDFITGNRRTLLAGDELVTALLIPKPRHPARSRFAKLGARKYLVISIAMVAAVVEAAEDGTVAAARVAVGACSPVARRLAALEGALAGRPLDGSLGEAVCATHLADLAPIDDIRAGAEYRLDTAATLVRRTLNRLGGGP